MEMPYVPPALRGLVKAKRRQKPWIRAHRMMGWPAPNEWVWLWTCTLPGHHLYAATSGCKSTWAAAWEDLEYHYYLQHPTEAS